MNIPQIALVESYSKEFQAQLRRINAYVNHGPSIGTAHEGILRRFLQKYIPKRYAVSEGFVLDINQQPSAQCDIIIWDQQEYSPVYIDGDFVIVQAGSVKAVIEVKTSLNKETLLGSYNNLSSVRNCGHHIYTGLFAFEGVHPREVLSHLAGGISFAVGYCVNSIYSMSGWNLQQIKDVPLDDIGRHLYEETRQRVLCESEELYPLTLKLHPPEKAEVYGLTNFLSDIFINLDLRGYNTPYIPLAGSTIHGYVFPGRGVTSYYTTLSLDGQINDDTDLLEGKLFDEYIHHLESHTDLIKNKHIHEAG